MFEQITLDFEPYTNSNITLEMVEQAYCSCRRSGFRFQVSSAADFHYTALYCLCPARRLPAAVFLPSLPAYHCPCLVFCRKDWQHCPPWALALIKVLFEAPYAYVCFACHAAVLGCILERRARDLTVVNSNDLTEHICLDAVHRQQALCGWRDTAMAKPAGVHQEAAAGFATSGWQLAGC